MHRLTTRTTRRVARALLLGCVISVGVAALSHVGVFAGWETRALDTFLFFRERTPSPAVVVVAKQENDDA